MIVGIGNTNLNYYFKNNLLIGINPGGVVIDTLLYLMNEFNCKYQGSLGPISYNILSNTKIDLTNTVKLEHDAKMFISENNKTNICPYCDRKVNNNYEYNNNFSDNDIVISDHFINKKAILVLDTINDIENLDKEEFVSKLSNNSLVILSLNVYHFIKDKYNLDSIDLGEYINKLVIYRGRDGIDFIIDGIIYEKEFENSINYIDSTGGLSSIAGVIIKYYLKGIVFDEKNISKVFIDASINYYKCISKVGSNSYILPISKLSDYSYCICENVI